MDRKPEQGKQRRGTAPHRPAHRAPRRAVQAARRPPRSGETEDLERICARAQGRGGRRAARPAGSRRFGASIPGGGTSRWRALASQGPAGGAGSLQGALQLAAALPPAPLRRPGDGPVSSAAVPAAGAAAEARGALRAQSRPAAGVAGTEQVRPAFPRFPGPSGGGGRRHGAPLCPCWGGGAVTAPSFQLRRHGAPYLVTSPWARRSPEPTRLLPAC